MKMIPYSSKIRTFRVLSDILPFLSFNMFDKYVFSQNMSKIELIPESAVVEAEFIFVMVSYNRLMIHGLNYNKLVLHLQIFW